MLSSDQPCELSSVLILIIYMNPDFIRFKEKSDKRQRAGAVKGSFFFFSYLSEWIGQKLPLVVPA